MTRQWNYNSNSFSVHGAVRRLDIAYDSSGRAYKFTSYDAASGGNIVNEVQREFNGLDQLTKEYQEHGGAVNTLTTPKIWFTHNGTAFSPNYSRRLNMIYPGGASVAYSYGLSTEHDNRISRVQSQNGVRRFD